MAYVGIPYNISNNVNITDICIMINRNMSANIIVGMLYYIQMFLIYDLYRA